MADLMQAPLAAGERETLEGFLDLQRAVAVHKATGLSEDLVRQRLVPSLTTVAGIIQHLGTAERYWFRARMVGDGWSYPGWPVEGARGGVGPADPADGEDPDAEWAVPSTLTMDDVVADYLRACDEARAIAAELPLEALAVVPGERGHYVSLRWVYGHMIAESARHNGHLDILRELLDG